MKKEKIKTFFSVCADKIKHFKLLSDEPRQRKKQIAMIVMFSLLIVAFITCYFIFGKQLLAFVQDENGFKAWLDSFGNWGKLVFVAVRALQTVVKIIPAEPLEIGAGYAFGTFGGLLYCMLGTEIGSLVIIILTKIFGAKMVNLFVSQEQINSLRFLQNKRKLSASLFIIYIIPGTPKDVITYLIGLTDYNIWKFLLLTGFARIPSIITSTWCGASLEGKNYLLSAVIFISTALVGLVGLAIYKKYQDKLNKDSGETKPA